MLSSAAAALGQMFDRKFRGVLWMGVALTFGLFVLLTFALQFAITYLPDFGLSWLRDAIRIVSQFLLSVAFIFMGAPVAQMFASIFIDRVADAVEARHYPGPKPDGATFSELLLAGLSFTAISAVLNLLSIPLQFVSFGIGAVVVVLVNGYLTGRTFFDDIENNRDRIIAHMKRDPWEDAERLRPFPSAMQKLFRAGTARDPKDRPQPLEIREDKEKGELLLVDGEEPVATAVPKTFDLAAPKPPAYAEALAAVGDDAELSAAVKAINAKMDTGEWVPTGETAPAGTLEQAELKREERRYELLVRELARTERRMQTLSDATGKETVKEQDLIPGEPDLTGGLVEIKDKDGKVISVLKITGDDLESWLLGAPVEAAQPAAP